MKGPAFFLTPMLLSLWACGGASPQSTLESYASALESSQPESAYRLLGAQVRERVSAEDFAAIFEEQANPGTTSALEDAAGEAAFIDASLDYSEFDKLEMSLGNDGWKIQSGLYNFYGQRSPRETLHSFIKAADARNYEAMLAFVPEAYVAHMSADSIRAQFEANPAKLAEMLELLRQNQNNLIRTQGSRAWMAYGPYRVDFVREGLNWKIEDPD